MLVFTRRPGEAFRIGSDVTVVVSSVSGKKVRIAIDAPREVAVARIDPPTALAGDAVDPPREPFDTAV